MSDDIQVGDVCLDLAQGRPVMVVGTHDGDAADWSERNDYALVENYANARLGAEPTDAVFDCVYCSNAKSEPSKDYAFPESRLLRIEHESATGERLQTRLTRQVLADLAAAAREWDDEDMVDQVALLASDAGYSGDLIRTAIELAMTREVIEEGDE